MVDITYFTLYNELFTLEESVAFLNVCMGGDRDNYVWCQLFHVQIMYLVCFVPTLIV